jgi:hypothetical protein
MGPGVRRDDGKNDNNKKGLHEAALFICAKRDYQMVTRSFGATYILSPGLTPNAS